MRADTMSWLLACSVKAAVLLAASWLGAVLLRRGSAAARHQIWTLGVAGALLLPLLCWALPSLSLSSETLSILGTRSFVAPAMLVSAGPASAAPTWPMWLAIAWSAGTLLVAFRWWRGHRAARGLVRTATPWLREIAVTIPKRVRLLRGDAIGSPMTIGVLRPRVLLPAAADEWSRDRLHAVLVHELGHIRRHDMAIQLAAQLACALYWWNPLVWIAAARLRIEREHACDDLVLGAGVLPSSYAADLLAVARSISTQARAHTGAICMADRSQTETRLRRILDTRTSRRPVRVWFRVAVSSIAIASAATLACTTSSPPAPTTDVGAPQPASLGTLSVGAPAFRHPEPSFVETPNLFPVSEGSVDLALVAAEVKRRLGSLEQCYERRLAVNPALSGTVVMHWVIDESGKVPEQCITTDTIDDHEISDCVNKLVKDGGFPAPRGGAVDVSFPFVFVPRAAVAAR